MAKKLVALHEKLLTAGMVFPSGTAELIKGCGVSGDLSRSASQRLGLGPRAARELGLIQRRMGYRVKKFNLVHPDFALDDPRR